MIVTLAPTVPAVLTVRVRPVRELDQLWPTGSGASSKPVMGSLVQPLLATHGWKKLLVQPGGSLVHGSQFIDDWVQGSEI